MIEKEEKNPTSIDRQTSMTRIVSSADFDSDSDGNEETGI